MKGTSGCVICTGKGVIRVNRLWEVVGVSWESTWEVVWEEKPWEMAGFGFGGYGECTGVVSRFKSYKKGSLESNTNVDEAPTAQTMFIANLSSAYPVYDEAG
ncbi:hypothetical protein Tco_0302407, partial [Tanacetum coccineum]